MTPTDLPLKRLLGDHKEALMADWRRRLLQAASNATHGEIEDLQLEMPDLCAALRVALCAIEVGDDEATQAAVSSLDSVLRNASQVRAARGLSPESSVLLMHGARDAMLAMLETHGPSEREPRQHLTQIVMKLLDRCVLTLVSQFVSTRESIIRSQAQSLLDMSTPVITLWDSILLLPLVGIVDSVRSVQVAERLLDAIGSTEAQVTLIDVTGVPVMDTSVARHLLRTVAAAEMLGTRVVLTGISPTTAQTMVKLGIDMSSVPTRGSLKAGVALALTMTGRQVRLRAES